MPPDDVARLIRDTLGVAFTTERLAKLRRLPPERREFIVDAVAETVGEAIDREPEATP